jgi:hypothetical protein
MDWERNRGNSKVDLGSRCKVSIEDGIYIIEYMILSTKAFRLTFSTGGDRLLD